MSEHRVGVAWDRGGVDFTYEAYSRDHVVTLTGATVPASAAPEFRGSPDRTNPEEAFVAALSTCHMLTFLALAARKRLVVESYRDDAVGILDKNEVGKLAMTQVTLRPAVRFAEPVAREVLDKLHHQAHEHCFIASSVKSEVRIEPQV